jgi:asparagine synthase (glutamine-hydrolysing)
MCGIAGVLLDGPQRSVERAELVAMNSTLSHRGPDDAGYFVADSAGLAMRRLAIVDLQTGQQPISNEDGTVWVVLNGEIYNYPELKRQLEAQGHIFRTKTDTEVLVHLYEEYGTSLVTRLNGMFAFALWDRRTQRLLLVRDRLGVKPLYYAKLADRLLFASEIKALLAAGAPREIDAEGLHHYLSLGYVPAPWTIFRSIRKLEAGNLMVACDAGLQISSYWDLPREDTLGSPPPDIGAVEEELRWLLRDAVRIRLMSDVPLGTFLSGGLDSSTIVSMLSKLSADPPKTFSVGFRDSSYDELPDARQIAQRFGTEHHESRLGLNVTDVIPVLQHHFDEPFADSSAIPTYQVCRMAREKVTVALGGDGGDELFAGYYTYQADRAHELYGCLPAWLRSRVLPGLGSLLPISEHRVSLDFKLRRFLHGGAFPADVAHYAWKEWLSEAEKTALYAHPPREVQETFSVFDRHYSNFRGTDPLNRHLYVDLKLWLADDILVKVDRMSMATSLELRGPFLDYRLAEYVARLPGRLKMPGFSLKHLLKRVMRTELPASVLSARKRGFSVPLAGWLRHELREVVGDLLSPSAVKRAGLFNPDMVQRWLHDQWQGRRDYSRPLWILFMFALWYDRYGRQS